MFEDTRRKRAVSDLVAFTLTFAIIVGGVGFVYIAGFDALGEIRDSERANSADRTMQGIAETYQDIHEENIPGRSLEVELGGSTLRTEDSRLGVKIFNNSSSPPSSEVLIDQQLEPNALVFDATGRDTRFVYELSGLFRLERQGQLVRHRPSFQCSEDRATLSLIQLNGSVTIGGDTSVVLVGQHDDAGTTKLFPGADPNDADEYHQPTDATKVTIDVSQMAASEAWSQYFRRTGEWEQSSTDGKFHCEVDEEGTVFLRRTVIELSAIY